MSINDLPVLRSVHLRCLTLAHKPFIPVYCLYRYRCQATSRCYLDTTSEVQMMQDLLLRREYVETRGLRTGCFQGRSCIITI